MSSRNVDKTTIWGLPMKVRARGEDIRRYILDSISKKERDISRITAAKFKISRQAVNKHLKKLLSENAITESGKTRSRVYGLAPQQEWNRIYYTKDGLAEDVIWRSDIAPVLGKLPDNVLEIWHYCFTEIFNNAIDHANAESIIVSIDKSAADTALTIMDSGVGVFKKIQAACGLLDERHAVLELSKGKLTTDPKRHSGEGIFFTSRMVDHFCILSGELYLQHNYGRKEDWVIDGQGGREGTMVNMRLNNHSARTLKKVFDQFSVGDEFGFNKTIIPVQLAQYGNDKLISRSQAKRLLSRIDMFKSAVFDFSGVTTIGQAFADEIFRVFANEHPGIQLIPINATSEVKRMIIRAISGGGLDSATPPTPTS